MALGLVAGAASAGDGAAFVSYSGVPSRLDPNGTATVTVTMRNTGTTTWETKTEREVSDGVSTTTSTRYALEAVGHGWGVGSVEVTGSVAPGASHDFAFTITAPSTEGSYSFQWRMSGSVTISHEDVPIPRGAAGTRFGATTPNRSIEVAAGPDPDPDPVPDPEPVPEPDTRPLFEGGTVAAKNWLTTSGASAAPLPLATGGNGALHYDLACNLPGGLSFDPSTRIISGTPAAVDEQTCRWTVRDSDDNTAESDGDRRVFVIKVREPGIRPVQTLTVRENDTTTYDVRLEAPPTGTVAVSVTSSDTRAATVSPGSLIFDPDNWTWPQTVTVKAKDDADAADVSLWIDLTARGGGYNGVSARVPVAVHDDDVPGLIVTPTGLEITEEGTKGQFTVRLETQPTGPVTVALTGVPDQTRPAPVKPKPMSLTFTTSNWDTTQTVTVSATHDDDASDGGATITVASSGADYGGFSASVVVAVTDNDTPHLVVRPTSLVIEEGATGNFTVKLGTLPTGSVTVSLTSDDVSVATVNLSHISFSTSDWRIEKTVLVTGERDPDADTANTAITVKSSGADYGGAPSEEVTVEVTDRYSVPEDQYPSFVGVLPIEPLTLVQDEAMAPVTLPAASGGDGDLRYRIVEALPDGLAFDDSSRILSGTPTAAQEEATYTYQVTDSDATDPDSASLSFTIIVEAPEEPPVGPPSFGSATIPDQRWTVLREIEPLALPTATDGTGELTYTLRGELPTGVDEDMSTRTISGTPTHEQDAVEYTYTATDEAGRTASLTFTITVVRPTAPPSFGSATIPDQRWTVLREVEPLTLPTATGGAGTLTYTLRGELPTGVAEDTSTRTISGTPTHEQDPVEYTYTATDEAGRTAALTFTIEVAREPAALDGAEFGSYSGVPSAMGAGATAEVTVTMRNTGSTTWTPAAGYELASRNPDDNATWGLNRVALPSDVAPEGTVDFTFTIRAPVQGGAIDFGWRMRKVKDWFGAETAPRQITVTAPSFGDEEVPDQAWVKDVPIEPVRLPVAIGGDGLVIYSLTPALPSGVSFAEPSLVLSGTPAVVQAGTEYTYTATDADGDQATLRFTIRVEEAPVDDAAFVSYSGVPGRMPIGGTSEVTVTMRNTGTTTWSSAAGYEPVSRNPKYNETWGVSQVSLPSEVPPEATVDFTFRITAPAVAGSHRFRWRMVHGRDGWFGEKTELVEIAVEDPSFGDAEVSDMTWALSTAVGRLTLPAAIGTGTLTYMLEPGPPAGVKFDASARTLSGTPTAVQEATEYVYTAAKTGGASVTLRFSITVLEEFEDDAAFVSYSNVPGTMAAGGTAEVTVRMRNSGTTTWSSQGGYALGSRNPKDNLRWGLNRVPLASDVAPGEEVDLTFTITAPSALESHKFRWRMRGAEGWFGEKTDLREITVAFPTFGSARIRNHVLVKDREIEPVVFPLAVGDSGGLTYGLSMPPPEGLTFDPATRTLSGTPTRTQDATVYGYRVRDAARRSASRSFWIQVVAGSSAASQSQASSAPAPGAVGPWAPVWAADSSDAVIAGPASGARAAAGPRAAAPGAQAAPGVVQLRGSASGGDSAADSVVTEEWIPVEGGMYRLSACMLRESAADNVFVDFDDGAGRDEDFADVHIVASSVGVWECGVVTKCLPASVGGVRVRAVREGANEGDAWFESIELERIAACVERLERPDRGGRRER